MANEKSIADIGESEVQPMIHTIGVEDLKDALAKGLDDFKAMPSHVLLIVVIYPVVGLFLSRVAFGYDMLPLVFPLIAGFTLIGPLAAIGLYEMSRRREQGEDVHWGHAFDVIKSPAIPAIAMVGLLQLAIYVVWLITAQTIYWLIFGDVVPESIMEFAGQVLATPAGWMLIIVGSGVGFLFAVLVLAISVVSFPLLLDRNVSAAMAIQVSVRSVIENPVTMAIWGLIVAVGLALGSLPLFVGLAVVMPVLGHATWHLYRKVVAR